MRVLRVGVQVGGARIETVVVVVPLSDGWRAVPRIVDRSHRVRIGAGRGRCARSLRKRMDEGPASSAAGRSLRARTAVSGTVAVLRKPSSAPGLCCRQEGDVSCLTRVVERAPPSREPVVSPSVPLHLVYLPLVPSLIQVQRVLFRVRQFLQYRFDCFHLPPRLCDFGA